MIRTPLPGHCSSSSHSFFWYVFVFAVVAFVSSGSSEAGNNREELLKTVCARSVDVWRECVCYWQASPILNCVKGQTLLEECTKCAWPTLLLLKAQSMYGFPLRGWIRMTEMFTDVMWTKCACFTCIINGAVGAGFLCENWAKEWISLEVSHVPNVDGKSMIGPCSLLCENWVKEQTSGDMLHACTKCGR